LTPQEFRERSEAGRFGPVGLTDSAAFLVHHLRFAYDEMRTTTQPVVSDHDFTNDAVFVAKNHVVGVTQEVSVARGSTEVLKLRLTMRIDASIEFDAISIQGSRP